MTHADAAIILLSLIDPDPGRGRYFSDRIIDNGALYLYASADDSEASLDGSFTANQLIAIATWMKEPDKVYLAAQEIQDGLLELGINDGVLQ